VTGSSHLAVGINAFFLNREAGGSGSYARELMRSMLEVEPQTRITAFVGTTVPRDILEAPWAAEVEWVRFPVAPVGAVRQLGVQFAAIPAIAARRRLDVVHGLANLVPPLAPRVVTVATLLDVTWIHYPTTMERRATLGMKVLAPMCARAADRVIAISHAAKDDVTRTLGLDPAKVDVTPLGIRLEPPRRRLPAEEVRKRFALGPGPVVLCVAQKRVHKNLAALVRAIAEVRDPAVRLVLPGSPTPHEQELCSLAAELGVQDRVRFPAWVDEDELEGLYGIASCFVLPSLAEGFGLPVLEAMRRDVPVACSNVSALPEVAGAAALLFDPHDVSAIAKAIADLAADEHLRRTMIERGRVRCREFTWERTARETLASYRRAIGGRRSRQLKRPRALARSSRAWRGPSPPS
jgi:glycosyltransferase involved in cell wall biosynthesis